jgi:hypothetical protein
MSVSDLFLNFGFSIQFVFGNYSQNYGGRQGQHKYLDETQKYRIEHIY